MCWLSELEIVCRLADIEYLDGSTEMDVPVSDLRPLLPVFVPPPRLPQSEVAAIWRWKEIGISTDLLCLPISIIFRPFPHVFSISLIVSHCEVCNTSINIRQFGPMAPQLLIGCSSSNRSTRERRCLIIVGTERRPVSGWAKREPTITNLYIDQRSFLRCLSSCMPQIDSNSFVGST